MGITGYNNHRPTLRPAAPRFSGGNDNDAGQQSTRTAPSSEDPKKMGFFKKSFQMPVDAFRCLKEELSDKETRNVIHGFGLKHIPELLMTAMCAIPGVGWLVNVAAIPLKMKLEKKGEEKLVNSRETLRKLSKMDKKENPRGETHKGLKHLIALDHAWNDPDPKRRYFGKNIENKHELPYYLAQKYNKATKGIFHKSKSLQNWLHLDADKNNKKGSMPYRGFRRWTEARQSLRQSKIFGKLFNWMSGINHSPVSKAMPRFIRLFFLVPRVGLNTLYFMLGSKPKFKP
jgi:hypothetical protein